MPAVKFYLSFLTFVLTIVLTKSISADTALTKVRSITKISDGIYMIRHPDAPDAFPQGNTTVIIGERDVLVVDACYLPSSAKEDIEQIKKWTNKPVRFLLNTHWHMDHNNGNSTYVKEYPMINIISHVETAKHIEGYNPGVFVRYPTRADRFRKQLDEGKDSNGKSLTEGEIKELEEAIEGTVPVYEEFKDLKLSYPDMTFDNELNIDLGNRKVQIKYLGKGNTTGDAIVYLPEEKVIVAGDLLDYPIPYLGGGFPAELVKTLRKMSELDAQTIIPGHGEVLHDKIFLNNVIKFVSEIVAEVSKETYKAGNGPRNLDAVRAAVLKSVDINYWRKLFAGDDKDNQDFFDGFSLQGVVAAAYAETWPR